MPPGLHRPGSSRLTQASQYILFIIILLFDVVDVVDDDLIFTKPKLLGLYQKWKGRSRRIINCPLRESRGDNSNDVPVVEPIVNESQTNEITESVEL